MCRVCGAESHDFHERPQPCDHAPGEHSHDNHHSRAEHARVGDEPAPITHTVALDRNLLAANNHLAAANRRWLKDREITLFNLIGSPGAGKTALLEATIPRLKDRHRVFVLGGDQATDLDARRIRQAGCDVVQINTGAACHLDASMIATGLSELGPARGSVVFIENVGNLVCPALFDLGEHAKVAVLSVTEGEDKPLKYPFVFRAAALLVLTKLDIAAYARCDVPRCLANACSINPELEAIAVAAQKGEGLQAWCNWIAALVAASLNKVVPA